MPTEPEAIIAAGLLAASPRRSAGATARLRRVLDERLTTATRWEPRVPGRPRGIREMDGRGLTDWVDPGPIGHRRAHSLAGLWGEALPTPDGTQSAYLRLSVESPADARHLRGIGRAGGRTLVPVVRAVSHGFEWRWPLRVGIVQGPHADGWLADIRSDRYHGEQFHADVIDPAVPERYEIVIIEGERLPQVGSGLARVIRSAGCVIGVGPDPGHVLERLLRLDPNIAIAMSGDDLSWWHRLFRDLTHDVPIDVAAVAADPQALVAADDRVLDATPVGQWAVLAGEQSGLPELAEQIETLEFIGEDHGSRVLNTRASAARQRGVDPVVRVASRAVAGVAGPTGTPGGGIGPDGGIGTRRGRRLGAEVLVGGKRRRRVLPPGTDALLVVQIAIPRRGAIALEEPFPDPAVEGRTATLEVTVTAPALWPRPQVQEIVLPMVDRTRPSNPAAFAFTTGASGSAIAIDIVVSYNKVPLQAATLIAAVRDVTLEEDRVRLEGSGVSGPSEPTTWMTPVDVRLDQRGQALTNPSQRDPMPVDLVDIREILDQIERNASLTLGADDAPDTLDARATALLVRLARDGHLLEVQLQDLDVHDARSIGITVAPNSPIVPLELAYSGAAPRKGARLCPDHQRRPPPPGSPCDQVSERVVCPYAFWGMYRRITRTVIFSKSRARPSQELPLTDVLFAAAQRADAGATQPLPTVELSRAAQRFGTRQRVPVGSWSAWRRAVARRKPAVLLIVGHTEVAQGETSIVIGTADARAKADITEADIHARSAPAPVVLLLSCSTGQVADALGTLPATFTAMGAGSVVATLTKLPGRQAAAAARVLLECIAEAAATNGSVGEAVHTARRAMVGMGLALGLLIVNHGDLDIRVRT